MKKQMDFNYKVATLEIQKIGRIPNIEERLAGIMIDLVAYENCEKIEQKELWLLINGECIETKSITDIKCNLVGCRNCKRTIIRRNLNNADVLKWKLSEYQNAKLSVLKRIMKSQEYYFEDKNAFNNKIKNLKMPSWYNQWIKMLGLLVAAKISDSDALQYFDTIDRFEVALQVPLELSQRKLIYESEKVDQCLENIENVIGYNSMKHMSEHITLYLDCLSRETAAIINYKDLYKKKTHLNIVESIKILNERYCG